MSFPSQSLTLAQYLAQMSKVLDLLMLTYANTTTWQPNLITSEIECEGGWWKFTKIMCNCVHIELLIDYSFGKPYCTFLICCKLGISKVKTTFLKNLWRSLILCVCSNHCLRPFQLLEYRGVRYPIWFKSMFEFCQKIIQFNIRFNTALPRDHEIAMIWISHVWESPYHSMN